jgi:hypothetical protein
VRDLVYRVLKKWVDKRKDYACVLLLKRIKINKKQTTKTTTKNNIETTTI